MVSPTAHPPLPSSRALMVGLFCGGKKIILSKCKSEQLASVAASFVSLSFGFMLLNVHTTQSESLPQGLSWTNDTHFE